MNLRKKGMIGLLAFLVANPACCCFGEYLSGWLAVEAEASSCCSSGAEREEPASPNHSAPLHEDCACSALDVVRAEPVASLSASGSFSLSLPFESAFTARTELPPSEKVGRLHLPAPVRGTPPIHILHQTFLL